MFFYWPRDGTTDTTRTVHFGVPTKHQKVSATFLPLKTLFSTFSFHHGMNMIGQHIKVPVNLNVFGNAIVFSAGKVVYMSTKTQPYHGGYLRAQHP